MLLHFKHSISQVSFSVPICLFCQNNQESLKRAMKSKDKELSDAKSASYKLQVEAKHINASSTAAAFGAIFLLLFLTRLVCL